MFSPNLNSISQNRCQISGRMPLNATRKIRKKSIFPTLLLASVKRSALVIFPAIALSYRSC
jgi:hypothetical protein